MAQSAVGAIRAGCQMLSEVTGIWGWLSGLFGAKPAPSVKPVLPAKQLDDINVADIPKSTKKQKRQPEPELSYEEYQARAVHEICENLKVYFEAMRQLKAHCRELEAEALTTEKVADSAIDRIEIQWQMNQLSAQLKQAMIWGTPEELGLGSMYKEFLAKYDEILEEQEVARELKAKKERNTAWRREHRKEIWIAKLGYVTVVTLAAIQLTGLYFTL
jgi:hypothetical protein